LLAFGDQGRHVLPLALGHTDGLGVRIALGAQPIGLHLEGLPLILQGLERLDIQLETAARQVAGDGIGIGTQQLRVNHVS
jgi:hypothetical protein